MIEPQGQTPESAGELASEIPTALHSIPGVVRGTAGYMSPEQARGKTREVDHRSDIFSFGCILYEAATGRRAFEGKDALDSLHKIVYAPTPLIRETNPTAPDELQRIVRRCLATVRLASAASPPTLRALNMALDLYFTYEVAGSAFWRAIRLTSPGRWVQ